jgi:hypothetical protein
VWSCKQAAQHVMTLPFMIVLNLKLKASCIGCRTFHLVACTPTEHVYPLYAHIIFQMSLTYCHKFEPKVSFQKGSMTESLLLAWCVYNGKGSNSLPLKMHIA